MRRPLRVTIAEPDAPTRAGLRLALRHEAVELHAEAPDAQAARAAAGNGDVALISVELPGGAFDLVRSLVKEAPAVRVVVLSDNPNDAEFLEAMRAGAAGYVPKTMNPSRLVAVIEAVANGEAAVPRAFSGTLLNELHGRDRERSTVDARAQAPLTDREWEVFGLLGERCGTAEIAHRLGISQVTVRRHVSSLMAKLQCGSRDELGDVLRSYG